MFRNLKIRNFRGLEDLSMEDTHRINLIAGRNNVGKTTLLESIYLLSGWGNPGLVPNVNLFRGLAPAMGPAEALRNFWWKPLFSTLDIGKIVEMSGDFEGLGKLTLQISLSQANTTEVRLDRPEMIPMTGTAGRHTLEFQFTDPSGRSLKGNIRATDQGLQVEQPNVAPKFLAIFLSSRAGSFQEDAIRLGQLRVEKQGGFVVEALQKIEPSLRSVEASTAGGSPMIWGDVGLEELVPLPVMGEGMTRIARLVLAIATAAGGVVLVDEIENGLHHSVLPKVWTTVAHAATRFNTQLFATTHSFECLEAAHSSLSASDFLLQRLESMNDGIRCCTYSQSEVDAAIKHGLEVR